MLSYERREETEIHAYNMGIELNYKINGFSHTQEEQRAKEERGENSNQILNGG